MEDLSDCEMQRYVRENFARQGFRGMGLGEKALDHGYSGDFRQQLGILKICRKSCTAEKISREYAPAGGVELLLGDPDWILPEQRARKLFNRAS